MNSFTKLKRHSQKMEWLLKVLSKGAGVAGFGQKGLGCLFPIEAQLQAHFLCSETTEDLGWGCPGPEDVFCHCHSSWGGGEGVLSLFSMLSFSSPGRPPRRRLVFYSATTESANHSFPENLPSR